MRKFINFRMNKRGAGRRAWWGAGRGAGVARGAGRAWCGRGRRRLGARNPAGPCSSVPFAPSPPRFFARGRRAWWGAGRGAGVARAWCGRGAGVARGATWCTKSRRPLYLRFLCTKSPAFFRPWPAPSWCTKSRRPLYLRSLCTKSHAFLRPWPAPTWCTKSRRPLFIRSLCTKSPAFFRPWPAGVVGRRAWCGRGAGVVRAWRGRGAGRDLVHEIPPALISPFPLHQVPRVFSPVAGAVLVHEIPRVLISPFPLHQFPRISSPVAGRAWCLTARYPSLSLVPSS